MGQVISICSGRGGTGKTTFTANIGVSLGKEARVLLIDGCIGLRNLDICLGVENKVLYNIIDVLEGRTELSSALIEDRRFHGVHFLPNAWMRSSGALDCDKFKRLVTSLRDQYDYILIDCPAVFDNLFRLYASVSDRAILVLGQDICSSRNADKTCTFLRECGIRDIQIVINRYNDEYVKKGIYMSVADIESILGYSTIGIIPESVQIMAGANKGEPVTQYKSSAGDIINLIADRIKGRMIPLTPVGKLKKIR